MKRLNVAFSFIAILLVGITVGYFQEHTASSAEVDNARLLSTVTYSVTVFLLAFCVTLPLHYFVRLEIVAVVACLFGSILTFIAIHIIRFFNENESISQREDILEYAFNSISVDQIVIVSSIYFVIAMAEILILFILRYLLILWSPKFSK